MKIMYKPLPNGKATVTIHYAPSTPSFYSGTVICISNTDKLSPFSYGVIYKVTDGTIQDNDGFQLSQITSVKHLQEVTGVKFKEVEGYKGVREVYFTGVLYCMESKDPHIFAPGYMYSVIDGIVNVPGYTNAIPKKGEEFIRELEKDFPAKFVAVTRMSD